MAVLVLLLCLPGSQLWAVEATAASAVFYSPNPQLHLYWNFSPASLRYVRVTDSTALAKVVTEVTFANGNGKYLDKTFLTQTKETPVKVLSLQQLFVHQTFPLQPGKTYVTLTMYQIEAPDETFTYTDSVLVVDVAKMKDQPWLSELQLLDTSYNSTATTSSLYNLGRLRVPRALRFYDSGQTALRYYAELYNTEKLPAKDFPLYIKTALVKKSDGRLTSAPMIIDSLMKGRNVYPITGQLDMSTVPSGNYYAVTWVVNTLGKEIGRAPAFVQTMNPNPAALPEVASTDTVEKEEKIEYLDLAKTFVAKYDDQQIRAILQMLLPNANGTQKPLIENFLKSPDPVYSRYFIYNYFEAINPQKPEKAWKEYADKVKEVNKMFGNRGGIAYNTDRGVVYLRYGEPTERIVVRSESNAQPYEIWMYNYLPQVGGTGLFLFYQAGRMPNDIRLLHSNVPGETQNQAWRSFLYPNGGDNVMTGRASQYFNNY